MKAAILLVLVASAACTVNAGSTCSGQHNYDQLLAAVAPCALTQTARDMEQECANGFGKGCACPDFRPYVPHHLTMSSQQQQDLLRFSGGSANAPAAGLGGGTFEIVGSGQQLEGADCEGKIPEESNRDPNEVIMCQESVQRFYAPGERGAEVGVDGVASPLCHEKPSGAFSFFHPSHNHWHATSVYSFTIHEAQPMTYGSSWCGLTACPKPNAMRYTNKVTFCLIDWVSVTKNNGNNGNDNTNNGNGLQNSMREYFDCESQTSILGISAGWLDQYHHSLPGMDLDMTELPDGQYFLVVTANTDCKYHEDDFTNNVAFIGFELSNKGKGGSRSISEIPELKSDTCCWDPSGVDPTMHQDHMCGDGLSNH